MVENKAPVVFVLTPPSQLGFLSTVLKDGLMTGIGVAATPSFDALRHILSMYPKRVYIFQLLHLKVITKL